MKQVYFVRGMLPVAAGVLAGLLLGSLCGESLCGAVLRSFGADSFSFVFDPVQTFLKQPAALLLPAAAAVWAGIAGIRRISAHECCNAL